MNEINQCQATDRTAVPPEPLDRIVTHVIGNDNEMNTSVVMINPDDCGYEQSMLGPHALMVPPKHQLQFPFLDKDPDVLLAPLPENKWQSVFIKKR